MNTLIPMRYRKHLYNSSSGLFMSPRAGVALDQINVTLRKTRLFIRFSASDLQDLAEKNILAPTGDGRSTHSTINL